MADTDYQKILRSSANNKFNDLLLKYPDRMIMPRTDPQVMAWVHAEQEWINESMNNRDKVNTKRNNTTKRK